MERQLKPSELKQQSGTKGLMGKKKKPEILPWFLTLGRNRKKVYEAQVFISKSKLKIRRIYSNMRTKTGP